MGTFNYYLKIVTHIDLFSKVDIYARTSNTFIGAKISELG